MFHRHVFRPVVLSLYCYTGEAVRPWAAAGYDCVCFDIQHPAGGTVESVGLGTIRKERLDLWDRANVLALADRFAGRVAFMSSFPVCTDMTVAGARHFAAKAAADPLFQRKAADRAIWCGDLGAALGCPWYAENPVSVLSTLWRRPDHTFHPWQFGGYLDAAEATHPRWPDYFPAFDCYTKKTCLWTGGGVRYAAMAPRPAARRLRRFADLASAWRQVRKDEKHSVGHAARVCARGLSCERPRAGRGRAGG